MCFEHQNFFPQLVFIYSNVLRSAGEAVPPSTAVDQVSQQPSYYLEEVEEEESYISEAIQEITDGTFCL